MPFAGGTLATRLAIGEREALNVTGRAGLGAVAGHTLVVKKIAAQFDLLPRSSDCRRGFSVWGIPREGPIVQRLGVWPAATRKNRTLRDKDFSRVGGVVTRQQFQFTAQCRAVQEVEQSLHGGQFGVLRGG